MSDSGDKVMIGIIAAMDAERLESRLARAGIEIATMYNHSSCKTGCSPSKEIWAHVDDVPAIQQLIHDEHLAALQDLGVTPEQINRIYDTSKSDATCPACQTIFSTKLSECPECGLVFA
jgi:hypothetical protein